MILVTGATGTVGRPTVQLLLAEGAHVGAITRDPAGVPLPADADVIGGDPSHPRTLASHLDKVDAVLVIPRAVGGATSELLSLAADHGVERAVVVSAVTVEYPAGLPRFAAEYQAVEDAAKASGLPITVLRCADFDANALAWAPQIRQGGVVYGAYAAAATSSIHQRDIAAVAAAALTGPGHQGHNYVLTGPQSLTSPTRSASSARPPGLTCPSLRCRPSSSVTQCSLRASPKRYPTGCSAPWPTTLGSPDRLLTQSSNCWAGPRSASPTGQPRTRPPSAPAHDYAAFHQTFQPR